MPFKATSCKSMKNMDFSYVRVFYHILSVKNVDTVSYGTDDCPQSHRPLRGISCRDQDIFASIERLADLRAKGVLSDDEFSAKKVELLSRL